MNKSIIIYLTFIGSPVSCGYSFNKTTKFWRINNFGGFILVRFGFMAYKSL